MKSDGYWKGGYSTSPAWLLFTMALLWGASPLLAQAGGQPDFTGRWIVTAGYDAGTVLQVSHNLVTATNPTATWDSSHFFYEASGSEGALLTLDVAGEAGLSTLHLRFTGADTIFWWEEGTDDMRLLRRVYDLPEAFQGDWRMEWPGSGAEPSRASVEATRLVLHEDWGAVEQYLFPVAVAGADAEVVEVVGVIDALDAETFTMQLLSPDVMAIWGTAEMAGPSVLYREGHRPEWLDVVEVEPAEVTMEVAEATAEVSEVLTLGVEFDTDVLGGALAEPVVADAIAEELLIALEAESHFDIELDSEYGIGVGHLEAGGTVSAFGTAEEDVNANLRRIADGASAYYGREYSNAVGEVLTNQLPTSVDWSPGGYSVVCGSPIYDTSAWLDPTWESVNFSLDPGHYFQYRFVVSESDGQPQFEVQARIDRDCDGVYGKLTLAGALGASGAFELSEIEESNAGE